MLTVHLSSKGNISYIAYHFSEKDTNLERLKESILSFANRNGAVFIFTAGSKIFITYEDFESMMSCSAWLSWLAF